MRRRQAHAAGEVLAVGGHEVDAALLAQLAAASARRPTRPGLPIMSPIIRTRQAPCGRGASPLRRVADGGRTVPRASLAVGGAAGRRLLRVLDGARLADDRDLDLARVGQLSPRSCWTMSRARRVDGEVVDLLGPDEDAHLATGLDGERALDAGEALGDGLEVLEALDVGVHRLAAGARPATR